MGTNYYVHEDACMDCGRYDKIHIGKSSYGWKFLFQYNSGQYYKTIRALKKWLSNNDIYDEEGRPITYAEFWEMVKEKQREDDHDYSGKETHEFKIEGYCFHDGEFS